MNAKNNDANRITELLRVIDETRERIELHGLSRESFLTDDTPYGRSVADSLLMCVVRATEEASRISEEVRCLYPHIAWGGIRAMRNILVHDYGAVDREIVWASIERDFPVLEEFCLTYCREFDISLER